MTLVRDHPWAPGDTSRVYQHLRSHIQLLASILRTALIVNKMASTVERVVIDKLENDDSGLLRCDAVSLDYIFPSVSKDYSAFIFAG